jgi:hypothetical protein
MQRPNSSSGGALAVRRWTRYRELALNCLALALLLVAWNAANDAKVQPPGPGSSSGSAYASMRAPERGSAPGGAS